jgi:hypothetical protein
MTLVRRLSWASQAAPTEAVVPILVGGPLPWMLKAGS